MGGPTVALELRRHGMPGGVFHCCLFERAPYGSTYYFEGCVAMLEPLCPILPCTHRREGGQEVLGGEWDVGGPTSRGMLKPNMSGIGVLQLC